MPQAPPSHRSRGQAWYRRQGRGKGEGMADRAMKQLKAQISRARKRRRVVAASIHLDAQCIVCGTWYKLSGPAQGSGRRTCSDKCKRIRTPRESKEAKRARDRKRHATECGRPFSLRPIYQRHAAPLLCVDPANRNSDMNARVCAHG